MFTFSVASSKPYAISRTFTITNSDLMSHIKYSGLSCFTFKFCAKSLVCCVAEPTVFHNNKDGLDKILSANRLP